VGVVLPWQFRTLKTLEFRKETVTFPENSHFSFRIWFLSYPSPISEQFSVPLAHSQACNPAHYRGLPHLTAEFVC